MDLLCYDDLDEFGRDIDDPLAELEQDIVHMLLESSGTNADAPDRSIGLEDALSGPVDPSLKHRIETKLLDDPRIIGVKTTITAIDNGNAGSTHQIKLEIQADQGELGIELKFDASGNVVRP